MKRTTFLHLNDGNGAFKEKVCSEKTSAEHLGKVLATLAIIRHQFGDKQVDLVEFTGHMRTEATIFQKKMNEFKRIRMVQFPDKIDLRFLIPMFADHFPHDYEMEVFLAMGKTLVENGIWNGR